MAYNIISPKFSFVQFGGSDYSESCEGQIGFCLPVYQPTDIAFQFIIVADDSTEADALCDLHNTAIKLGTKQNCSDVLTPFTSKPERYRLSDTQILFNWQHGIQNLADFKINECFRIGVDVPGDSFCSNCLIRIDSDCYTAVLEYGNEENSFGFNYCNSGTEEEDVIDCSPTIISFTNQATMVIPYTAAMVAKYGVLPAVQTWIYNTAGELQDMGISSKFDTYPPTKILFDFGGPASGIIKIL